jgi:WS/DGAT/MGAT family acyltransferase
MASSPPKRLSAHDSVFLSWERPEQPMHVAECMVYDGHITAADIVRMIGDRMHLLPRYRQKIVPAPFGIAHPTWEDDPDFDVAHHVDEQTLPSPGDDQVLSRVCGELYCHLLDRDRPLWHLTVLHGHAGGGTVIFLKLHHAMVDGVSSVELIEVLHATERGAAPPAAPASTWEPRPLPGRVERLRHVVADEVAHRLDGLREVGDLVRPGALGSLAKRVRALTRAAVDTGPLLVRPLPPTPFNAPIHPQRDFAWVELPLAEVKAVRAALGGTINDLVLAVLGGGLARYMARHGVEPDGRQLEALCPVSVRRQDQSGAMGNLISMVVAPLYVGIPDGAQRLAAERAAMEDLKRREQAAGIYEVIAASNWCPAPLWRLVWKLWPRTYFPFHITSTNVPGPRQPLFLGEHELLHWYPFGVQWTNNGLFLCTLSYREYLTLGPVADPDVVPDVWDFADDLRAAYEELRAAAGVAPAAAPQAGPSTASAATARRRPSTTAVTASP